MGDAAVEERLSSLEIVLESFIMSTHVMIREIKNENAKMKQDSAEFKRNIEKTVAEMKQDTVEFKSNMDKTVAEMKRDTAKMKKEMNRQWGDLANKMGTMVEDIVAPNIAGIAKQYFNVETLAFFAVRVKCQNTINPEIVKEFDVIAVSDHLFFVNETKSTVKIGYVDDFTESLKSIYDYFPQNRGKKLIPIFSALHIPDDIQNYLTRHNIYAMGMKEETMDLLNFEELSKNG